METTYFNRLQTGFAPGPVGSFTDFSFRFVCPGQDNKTRAVFIFHINQERKMFSCGGGFSASCATNIAVMGAASNMITQNALRNANSSRSNHSSNGNSSNSSSNNTSNHRLVVYPTLQKWEWLQVAPCSRCDRREDGGYDCWQVCGYAILEVVVVVAKTPTIASEICRASPSLLGEN